MHTTRKRTPPPNHQTAQDQLAQQPNREDIVYSGTHFFTTVTVGYHSSHSNSSTTNEPELPQRQRRMGRGGIGLVGGITRRATESQPHKVAAVANYTDANDDASSHSSNNSTSSSSLYFDTNDCQYDTRPKAPQSGKVLHKIITHYLNNTKTDRCVRGTAINYIMQQRMNISVQEILGIFQDMLNAHTPFDSNTLSIAIDCALQSPHRNNTTQEYERLYKACLDIINSDFFLGTKTDNLEEQRFKLYLRAAEVENPEMELHKYRLLNTFELSLQHISLDNLDIFLSGQTHSKTTSHIQSVRDRTMSQFEHYLTHNDSQRDLSSAKQAEAREQFQRELHFTIEIEAEKKRIATG